MKQITLLCLLSLVMIIGCEKEEFTGAPDVENQQNIMDDQLSEEFIADQNYEIAEVFEDPKLDADSRSAITLLLHQNLTLRTGQWKALSHPKGFMADPLVMKYGIETNPAYGNPDIYIYAYDIETNSYRFVRSSNNGPGQKDFIKYRKTDLKNFEDAMYILIYAHSTTNFDLNITKQTVDCVEDPPAPGFMITYDYFPVCGCDGNEYPNTSSAIAAGVTSWNDGSCFSPEDLIVTAPCANCDVEIFYSVYDGIPGYYVQIENCQGIIGLGSYVVDNQGEILASNTNGPYPAVNQAVLIINDMFWSCNDDCPNEESIVADLQVDYPCANYNSVSIHSALYKNQSVLFVEVEYAGPPSTAPTKFVYDCSGEIVASNGLTTPEYQLHDNDLVVGVLIFTCP